MIEKYKIIDKDSACKIIDQYDVISFDIFDTLITRRVVQPADVFLIVEKRINKLFKFQSDFYRNRIEAESVVYKKNKKLYSSVEEIYREIAKRYTNLTQKQIELINHIEFDVEKKVVCERKRVKELFDLALKNKTVILVSDMYYGSKEIKQLLDSCNYNTSSVKLYVSSEYKKEKNKTDLWNTIKKDFKGKRILHIGDNYVGDYLTPTKVGIDCVSINNPYDSFLKSELYRYLGKYDNREIGHSLVLGKLINCVVFNSIYKNDIDFDDIQSLWFGPIFKKFISFIHNESMNKLLLFITRENIVLRPMYNMYCRNKNIVPNENVDYFASRRSLAPINIIDENGYYDAFKDGYEGNLGNFAITHFNYKIADKKISEIKITLPINKNKAIKYLDKYKEDILDTINSFRENYLAYLNDLIKFGKEKQLCIIDIGYRGTAQYLTGNLLKKKINGIYLLVNPKPYLNTTNCDYKSVDIITNGRHPLYDNLLFLESVMMVRQGTTLGVGTKKENYKPILDENNDIGYFVEQMQNNFIRYVAEEAQFEKDICIDYDTDLLFNEDIFASLIKCGIIPKKLMSSLSVEDRFSGNVEWKYDINEMCWKSKISKWPFIFSPDNKISLKIIVKNYVKKISPGFLYEFLRMFWVKYLK